MTEPCAYEFAIFQPVKVCTRCKIAKPETHFDTWRKGGTTLRSHCKKCCLETRNHRRRNPRPIKPPRLLMLTGKEKLCRRCSTILDYAYFNKDKTKKDGLDNYCRNCRAKIKKEIQAR